MSTLESSVTLDDVFVVVGARRVPLAPELAGYLALEVAEGATQAAGDVDPRSVYISEEGSVALVRPRREQAAGDAEASIRAILTRLLDASGSQTPALASAARRRPSAGLNVLVEELEAALIPVNRAAGRRALARLAREVKRVTLGVGRNASLAPGEPPPRRASSPSHSATSAAARDRDAARATQEEPRVPPVARSGFSEELPTTSRFQLLADPNPPAVRPAAGSEAPPPRTSGEPTRDSSELPTVALERDEVVATIGEREPARATAPATEPRAPREADEVDHLLASFGVSARGEHSQRNDLKALVGLEPTPPPLGSVFVDDAPAPSAESDVESLLAISEAVPAAGSPGKPVAPAAVPVARPHSSPSSSSGGVLASPPTAISPVLANEPYRAKSAAASPPRTPKEGSAASKMGEMRGPLGSGSVPTAPSARRIAEMASRPSLAPPRDRSLTVFGVIVLALAGVALWALRPKLFGGHDAAPNAPSALPTGITNAPVPAAPRCRASLNVTGAPTNAEILVRAGQAPVDVEKMPVGARLEFVATAEGYAPKRAVVPAGASWDTGSDGKPRYEVAVQLDHSRLRGGSVDPWPAGEPGSEVGGKGAPGTVHLVTTPRGAEVWQLAGLGPEAQFDVRCGGEVEVLVAGPGTLRKRLRIPEHDFVTADGGVERQASVNMK